MRESATAYLESQYANFGGSFEMEYTLERDPQPTGIKALDDALGGGLAGGTYTIIGGTAGVGKSALACAIFYGMATMGSNPLYISCEMPAQQVRMRLASMHSQLTNGLMPFAWSRARDSFRANFTSRQLKQFVEADDEQRHKWADAYIRKFSGEDPVLCSWRDMESRGIAQRAMVREDIQSLERVAEIIQERADNGILDAVIIDYAQLLDVPGCDSEYERMTKVSRTLQQVSKGAGCPVLLISSLRNIGKDEKEPGLSWFRGSGYLGYDAGAAIILRGGAWATRDDMGVDAHIVKNRNGRIPDGPVKLTACPKYGTFE